MSKEAWWTQAAAPAAIRSDNHEWVYQWAQQTLARLAIENGEKAPLRVGAAGPIAHEEVYKQLCDLLSTQGAHLVEESFYVWDDDFEEVHVWDTGAAFITGADESTQLGVNVVTTDCKFGERVREFLHENIHREERTNRGLVSILVQNESGIRPQPIGFAAVPLDVENYDSSIHESLTKTLSDLRAPFPDGRLTILEGPPGCGKTFMLRSIIHEVPSAKFIFVPPAMVPHLGEPSMVSALLSLQGDGMRTDESIYTGPTVLICEDADSILTKRAADNMSATSAVLNLTSGLPGDVIDIRIIATTNAARTDIEPALLRSGRLAEYIQVPPIDHTRATSILRRLTGKEELEVDWPPASIPQSKTNRGAVGFATNSDVRDYEKVLLADVFKVAKTHGWKPKRVKPKSDAAKILARRPRPYAAKE